MSHEPSPEALLLALRAYALAHDAGADPWQFALAVRELAGAGLTATDVRWLVLKGYASLAKEVTTPGDPERQFRPLPFTAWSASSCLALTEAGATELGRRVTTKPASGSEPQGGGDSPTLADGASRPRWDAGRRELLVGDTVVKRFRVPAANQELVLQAFEEDGWPSCIDDPLPPAPGIDCQHRLRATIKSLNRSQSVPLIRFHGNGGGQVIYWDLVAQASSTARGSRLRKV